ncbi:MAG TPA: DUF1835 domain-containing protein [Puia sp.]|jgi:hypothetical protein|nr:DUF1835 domain-containing protein [Puia sp.]
MFHIVFDPAGAGLLNDAMDLDMTLDGETILFRDDYSVGPIQDLFNETGREERISWWNTIRADAKIAGPHEIKEEADSAILSKIIQRMEDEEFDQIWIWVAPNVKDVCGYYWLISQLKSFSGRIFILSLNNLPFINEKGHVFYPVSLSEIPAREYIKAKKLARPVSLAEFETDPDEWLRLVSENKNLRLLEGGKKIVQKEDDYYDKAMLHFLQPQFQKISRTVHQFIVKSPEKLNENFLLWRLNHLIAAGTAEQNGEMVRLMITTTDEPSSVRL